MSHVFISYSKKNRIYARAFADKLLEEGFDVWIDDRIDYGENWERTIFEAIDTCAAFTVIMTPESYESVWVQRECHHAEKRGKPPFPVLLDGDEEFPRYGLTQYVDLRGGRLPPPDFYTRLGKFAPRSTEPGAEVISEPETKQVLHHDITSTSEHAIVIDDDMAQPVIPRPEDMVIPPQIDERPVRPPQPSRKRPQVRLIELMVVIAVISLTAAGAIVILNEQNPQQTEPTISARQGNLPAAWNLYEDGQYDNAVSEFDAVIADDAENADAYYGRGRAYFDLGEYGKAVTDFEQALALDPDIKEAYVYSGHANYHLEQNNFALQDYTNAIDAGLGDSDVYANRGLIYYHRGEYDHAIGDFDNAIEFDDHNPWLFAARGDVYYSDNQLETALTNYQTAADLEPDESSFYQTMGDILYDMGQKTEALEQYKKYVARAGDDADTEVVERIEELEE